jgi:hypothetical protein
VSRSIAARRPVRAAVVALVSMSALAACGSPPPIDGQGYRLVFQDDFDGSEPKPLWVTAPFGDSLLATVSDGVLTLRSTAANEHRWGYVAGTGPRLDEEPSYPFAAAWQEGYFEARIRYTDDPWAWPAFWLFSMAKTEAWPEEDCRFLNAEWDIMENGVHNYDGDKPASRWFSGGLHRNTSDNTPDGYCGQPDEGRGVQAPAFPDDDLSAWHTWGGRWTDDEMCHYLDGVEVGCVATFDSTAQLMHIVFTIQYLRTCGGCPARPPELTLDVDWVRVWQLPDP